MFLAHGCAAGGFDMHWSATCGVVLLCLTACESAKPNDTLRETDRALSPTDADHPDFSQPPPNAPPPPASCGDMNGGGDQHVDFPALMQAKVAEKPEVEARQSALLAA